MKATLLCSTALLLSISATARAEDAAEPATDIIVTGTRQIGMKAEDSPAPVQVIGAQALQSVGQQDLTQVLAQSLPSLNFQAFGGDTANLTLTAALRGLSPNDTLVLVNGKRRHGTANLAVLGGSPYSGAATTDFSFIPTASISRIEVLQDSAAAQYGSDAIAGVVNVITKNADHGGLITVTGGSNYQNGGETAAAAANFGFGLGDRGFVNVTGEYRFSDYTQHGQYDRRFFTPTGQLLPSLNAVQVAGLRANPRFPNVNNINGNARFSLYNVAFNAGYDLTDDLQLYAFGSYGNRNAKAFQNYRAPDRVSGRTSTGTVVYPLPLGFNPQENIREEDFSLTAGLKGTAGEWNYDLSLTYGRDAVALFTIDSANPVLFSMLQSASATPLTGLQRNFYDGQLTNSEWVGNIDVSRDFEVGFAKPLTLALGGEFRKGTYQIAQGEYASYIFGGAQAYPGFAPSDAGKFGRKSYAGYIDIAADPVDSLHLDVAGRYEHYSDFGSAWSGKFTARYDFSDAFALRGTVSNGFRAPSLAESYYSSVNVGPGSTFGQLPPNSSAAQLLGFAQLRPEKSTNVSVGLVLKPLPGLQVTIDAYQIKLKNRIVPSGDIYGTLGTSTVSQAVVNALISRGVSLADATSYAGINIFTNGVDTRTRGVEATANYTSDFGDMGRVDWSLGLNYNKTDITRVSSLPAAVFNAAFGQTDLLSVNAKDALSTATPRVKSIANALWSLGSFSLNLRGTVYGSTRQRQLGDQVYQTAIGTTFIADLNVGYKLTPLIRFDVGANNLFDKQAPTLPLRADGTRPITGNVFNAPLSYTPWGINGGYYYARATINF
ncbi:TonB-dependent receptor plug domain-containing protein [Novosphingobium piscinae]|uniref:TonB-dependent receptor n=1 Tax=Novosphingobium piscinae TaxID=1507448 RepID=A0A7X1KPM1_9SPHN|nr:TonB-dependent receptor [Novosphingobium piscinae]MBC2668864.1 TonB-dependent receptor [Novosphingobium piscinae]